MGMPIKMHYSFRHILFTLVKVGWNLKKRNQARIIVCKMMYRYFTRNQPGFSWNFSRLSKQYVDKRSCCSYNPKQQARASQSKYLKCDSRRGTSFFECWKSEKRRRERIALSCWAVELHWRNFLDDWRSAYMKDRLHCNPSAKHTASERSRERSLVYSRVYDK